MMEKEFERFIEEKELLKSGDKLLVAVSGGVDSMVLCELLWRSKISFGIAHVNYGLRGEDSLKDERLVRNFAKGYKLDFHLSQPNTEAEAKNWKKGIQETARELRYAFFSELMEKHGYTKLATAHHGDDSAETMLYNFIKGTGLSGLKGIDVHRDRIIRPLLFSNKKDILDYALTNRVPFREDKSNAQAKYDRNKIRNKIVPQLREINPAVLSTLHEKSEVFREASALLNESIQRKIDSWVQVDDGVEFMPVQELKNSNYQRLVLWEWLERGLFTSKQMEQILKLINAQKGKEVVGKAGRVIREQDSLSFTPVNDSIFEEKQFNNLDELLEFKDWQCEILGETALGNPEPSVAYFDLDKIQFPLHLRRWKPGDRFKPLGLKGSQKVKEFLTHQKIPSAKREDVLVLCSITENQTDICWLVGYRISDNYKVDNETQNVLKCDPKK